MIEDGTARSGLAVRFTARAILKIVLVKADETVNCAVRQEQRRDAAGFHDRSVGKNRLCTSG